MQLRTIVKGAAAVFAAMQLVGMASRMGRGMNLRGKTALVCGASRGLGRAVALELARRGCKVAICARSEQDLEEVRAEIARAGGTVYAEACDLRSKEQVDDLVANVVARLGSLDVVVANAATIEVGPIESMTVADFDTALNDIFKTSLHPALAALPKMREAKRGTLAFVTSIGAKVGVPHLAPYSAAKFAELGFAEALRAEAAKDRVHVLTIVPGLMRTGSYVHAAFKGDSEKEYAWFGAGSTSPLTTMSADRAARRIVRAIARGDSEIVLTLSAKLAARANGIAPGLVSFFTKMAGRLLPAMPDDPMARARLREGVDIEGKSASPAVAAVKAAGLPLQVEHNQT